MIDWEELSGVEFRLLVDTDTALAKVLGVSRPSVAQMERDERIARGKNGWDVFQVVEDWRGSTNPYMQRTDDRPWLDVRLPLDAPTLIALVRRTRAVGGVVQARWKTKAWVDAPDPIERLRSDVLMEPSDLAELDVLYPEWWPWFGFFAHLTDRVAERFKLDQRAVRKLVWGEGREYLAMRVEVAASD